MTYLVNLVYEIRFCIDGKGDRERERERDGGNEKGRLNEKKKRRISFLSKIPNMVDRSSLIITPLKVPLPTLNILNFAIFV